MQGASDWRPVLAISCSFAVILVAFILIRKSSNSQKTKETNGKSKTTEINNTSEKTAEIVKSRSSKKIPSADEQTESEMSECESSENETISDLPYPRWVKVGQVQQLYLYPLKSGRGKEIQECDFEKHGICIKSPGKFTLRDRMFLVYNKETGRFQTGRKYPTLILVSVSAVDEFKVKLEAVGMPSVIFRVPDGSKETAEAIECTMWWGEPVKCIDCGPEAAEWISRFLTGTNSGLRVAYAIGERNIVEGPWEKYANLYYTMRKEDAGLFSDIASYMLMTSQSLEKLNEKLERPVPALQFRPNIVVSGDDAFAEDNWEWIKIGDSAVIRNFKPCSRCNMIKIHPETGVADKEEPYKTLKSMHELKDPEKIAVEGNAPLMGVYCGLYVPGKVKIGDDVFLHVPDDYMEISYHQITPIDES